MTLSSLINVLVGLRKDYGDRSVKYIGIAGGNVLFEEDITTVKCCSNDLREPVILCGDSYHELVSEPLIELNWVGRLFKRFITRPKK